MPQEVQAKKFNADLALELQNGRLITTDDEEIDSDDGVVSWRADPRTLTKIDVGIDSPPDPNNPTNTAPSGGATAPPLNLPNIGNEEDVFIDATDNNGVTLSRRVRVIRV
jgi:hypothetical protein